LVKLLLDHGAEVNHKDKGGHTALMIAAFGAMIKNAPLWLASALLGLDENDELFTRIGSEHNLAAQVLLKGGADVNAQAEDCGMTTLMVAALSGNAELAKILLANKADVNIKNGERSALRYAESLDSPESLQSELKDCKDNEERQTFLNWIHLTAPGRHEIARMLRKAGAGN
jgi:ankyrin repeat protein